MTNRATLLILLACSVLVNATLTSAETLKTVVNPEHLANTTQFDNSQATIVLPKARVIYVAGQIGITDEGPNDFESQVDRSFANLISAVEAAGGRIEDIVKLTLLVKNHDQKKLQYLANKSRQVFGENSPASTLIPVPALAVESLEFEIDAVIVAPPVKDGRYFFRRG